jgi:hypothetical protein
MSRPFTSYSAKAAFGKVNGPLRSCEYIRVKKNKYTFCASNTCHANKNILSRQKNQLTYPYASVKIDKTQLYSNLYTKLDLSDLSRNTPFISDLSGNTFPVLIDTEVAPFLKYNIDPSGNLFGNTVCGIDNYLNYVKFDASFN